MPWLLVIILWTAGKLRGRAGPQSGEIPILGLSPRPLFLPIVAMWTEPDILIRLASRRLSGIGPIHVRRHPTELPDRRPRGQYRSAEGSVLAGADQDPSPAASQRADERQRDQRGARLAAIDCRHQCPGAGNRGADPDGNQQGKQGAAEDLLG